MKVLITGGAGFIGSAVVRQLAETADLEIIVVDKFTYAANRQSLAGLVEAGRIRVAELDVCDAQGLNALFEESRPDAVMHLAAESHVDRSITGAAAFIETNVVGTYVLLEAARSYWTKLGADERERFRFLHVSTDEVYGSLGDEGVFSETSPYDPSSPYAASKASADHLVSAWGRTYDLPVLITNCSNNFGPRQHPEKLIPLMILNGHEGKSLPVYGEGVNVRDWLHVEDHARALEAVLHRGRIGETYNIGARCERRNLDVVRTICARLDEIAPKERPHADLIEFVTDRLGHDARYAIDPAKIEAELGWRPKTSFGAGLRATVDWYLDNREWWAPMRAQSAHAPGGE